MISQQELNIMNFLGMAIIFMNVPTKKRVKLCRLYGMIKNDFDNKGSNDNSNNFVTFTATIGYANSFLESILENTNIDDEDNEANDNEDL